jgi:anti-sigma factor RsiW
MTTCDDILEALFLSHDLDPAAAAHVQAHLQECPACGAQAAGIEKVSAVLRASTTLEPPPALGRRTLAAAAPLLAERAAALARGYRRRLTQAVAAALLPLPAVLALDAYAVRALHGFLSVVLPSPVSAYLAFNFAALVVLTIALTYAAVPVLADRQLRLTRREGYA